MSKEIELAALESNKEFEFQTYVKAIKEAVDTISN